jgi:hypothetical protein
MDARFRSGFGELHFHCPMPLYLSKGKSSSPHQADEQSLEFELIRFRDDMVRELGLLQFFQQFVVDWFAVGAQGIQFARELPGCHVSAIS